MGRKQSLGRSFHSFDRLVQKNISALRTNGEVESEIDEREGEPTLKHESEDELRERETGRKRPKRRVPHYSLLDS